MPPESVKNNLNIPKKVFLLVGILLLFCALMIAIVSPEMRERVFGSFGKPDGSIYLSLRPTDLADNLIGIYKLDLPSQKLEPFIISSTRGSLTGTIAPDKLRFAYAEFEDDQTSDINIAVYDISTDKSQVLSTTPELKIRRNPVWSSDGRYIAYLAKSDFNAREQNPDKWFVYLYDFESKMDRFLTSGSNPVFVPRNKLLVLKSDGLYLYEISESTAGKKIWGVSDGTALVNMKISVSPNGQYLAWSLPNKNQLVLIRVNSWEKFDGVIEQTIDVKAGWSVFSPDSRTVAYQAYDYDKNGNVINSRIFSRNIKKGNEAVLIDLSHYDQNSIFMTDWK